MNDFFKKYLTYFFIFYSVYIFYLIIKYSFEVARDAIIFNESSLYIFIQFSLGSFIVAIIQYFKGKR